MHLRFYLTKNDTGLLTDTNTDVFAKSIQLICELTISSFISCPIWIKSKQIANEFCRRVAKYLIFVRQLYQIRCMKSLKLR